MVAQTPSFTFGAPQEDCYLNVFVSPFALTEHSVVRFQLWAGGANIGQGAIHLMAMINENWNNSTHLDVLGTNTVQAAIRTKVPITIVYGQAQASIEVEFVVNIKNYN